MATVDIQTTLANRIKEARLDAGLTTEALARELDISTRTVAGWQSGRSAPSYKRLARLSELLNKPLTFFLGGNEK